jgi:subfamily B ATP-binding cassette protein MsbA
MVRRNRGALALSLLFAMLSAGGLGLGLLSLAPILRSILGEGSSLAAMAIEHNAAGRMPPIPPAVVGRLPTDPLAGVATMIGALAVLTVLGAACNFLHQFVSQTATTRAVADVRADAFAVVVAMPIRRVIERGPSEFVARIVRDAAELQRGLIALVSKSIGQVTKGLAGLAAAIYFDWRLTLAALVIAPLVGLVLRKLGKRVRRGTHGSLRAQEGLLRVATETLQGLRAVKASTAERTAQNRFDALNAEVVRHELRVRTARALSAPLVETLAVFAIGAVVLAAAAAILHGRLLPDHFFLVLGSLGVAGGALRPLVGLVTEIQASSAPARRLMEVLEEPAEPAGDRAAPLARHRDSIAFEGVRVEYAGRDRPALDGLDLRIGHGERVAIVGPNGSGKTTLVSLVPRLLDPDAGRVLVDGTDIRTVDLPSLRRQIGLVTQEVVLFRGSVADNIAFGADASRGEIVRAAEQAHAHEFIARLPGGYDADLAEQGSSLSGGQRQRIAIARAILRDPAILILDEATSQIDSESEAHINAALSGFMRGRTTIVVAHRLSTVLGADRIVVLDEGCVVDQGGHDELLSRCALYRRLAQTQLGAGDSARVAAR